MLSPHTNALAAILADHACSPDQVKAASCAFLGHAKTASRDEQAEALTKLAGCFSLEPPFRGGMAALVCGALVENGADPKPMVGPMIELLGIHLKGAARLSQACEEKLKQDRISDEDEDEAFEAARKALEPAMAVETTAWESLDALYLPAIAMFSASPAARETGQKLASDALKLERRHTAGPWLTPMLAVLHDEPFLALEPSTARGISGKMSGIADNFQLHVLLMEAFPRGILTGRRISAAAVAQARGDLSNAHRESVSGVWNLYNWQALQPGPTLPRSSNAEAMRHWIWSEGKPADIAVFEGARVILLGPSAYPRSWNSGRRFEHLPASLTVEKVLHKLEVRALLSRILVAGSKA